jgi:hypothetical protein
MRRKQINEGVFLTLFVLVVLALAYMCDRYRTNRLVDKIAERMNK